MQSIGMPSRIANGESDYFLIRATPPATLLESERRAACFTFSDYYLASRAGPIQALCKSVLEGAISFLFTAQVVGFCNIINEYLANRGSTNAESLEDVFYDASTQGVVHYHLYLGSEPKLWHIRHDPSPNRYRVLLCTPSSLDIVKRHASDLVLA